MLTPEEIQIIQYGIASGKTKQQSMDALMKYRSQKQTSQQPPTQQRPTLGQELGTVLEKRKANFGDIVSAQDRGEQGYASTLYQTGGQLAGLGADVIEKGIGRGVGAVYGALPEGVRESVSSVGKGIGSVLTAIGSLPAWNDSTVGDQLKAAGQLASTNYDAFREQHPELARNLEATGNIGRLASDLSLVKTGVDATAKVAGKAMQGAKTLAGKAGSSIKGSISPALEKVGGLTEKAGKTVYDTAIPLSAKEAKSVQGFQAGVSKQPITAADTALKMGFQGTEAQIGVQARKETNKLWNTVISPALKNSKTKVDMKSFFDEVEKNIIKETPELSRRSTLLKALEALKSDYSMVGSVRLDKLQKFKEGWAKFVPQKAYKGEDIAGAFNDVKNSAAELARQKIHSNIPLAAREAYFDYGNLKNLQQFGQKAMTGAKFKGGFGSFVSGLADMLVVPAKTAGGQVLSKAGKKLTAIGGALKK